MKDHRYVLADWLLMLAINGNSEELFEFAGLPSKEVLIEAYIQLDRLNSFFLAVQRVIQASYPPEVQLGKIREAMEKVGKVSYGVADKIMAVQQNKHPAG